MFFSLYLLKHHACTRTLVLLTTWQASQKLVLTAGQACLGFFSMSPGHLPGSFCLGGSQGTFSGRQWTPQAHGSSGIRRRLWISVYCWSCFRVNCTISRVNCSSVCSWRPFLAMWPFFPLGQSLLHFEFSWGPLSESRIRIIRPHPFVFLFSVDHVKCVCHVYTSVSLRADGLDLEVK